MKSFGPKRKALIVEDNEVNRDFLTLLLEDEFDFICAENGLIGLEKLSEHYQELSIVFLDVNMPVMNGYEFLEKIKNDVLLNSIPIIVTTGTDSQEEEIKCLELGASDFVTKPYNPLVVLGRARSLIKLHESVSFISIVENDSVTGFYTMQAFKHHFYHAIHSNPNTSYDLIVFDTHDFKLINNVYGHSKGDELLHFFAQKCKSCFTESIIGRNADRIYCAYPSKFRISEETAIQTINEAIATAPIPNVPLNCGCYLDVDRNLEISLLCDRVRMAVDGIKDDISVNFAYYNETIKEQRIKNQTMEIDFDKAIENKEFKVWFQPKVDIQTEDLIGAEALVRWIKPDGKFMSPADFIPLFERDGLIHRLDEYIFNEVCDFLSNLLENDKKIVPVSVNLSRNSVYYRGTIDRYVNKVASLKLPINLVPIELTESAATEGQRIIELAKKLISAGFSLHMDDFGAGYSSLSSLGSIPFDVIKVDKSLVDQIGTKTGEILLTHSIQIAQDLGMKVVVEGVENKTQLDFLKKLNCNITIQGYYYSAPVKLEDFTRMLGQEKIDWKKTT